jgi:hypothetical protein
LNNHKTFENSCWYAIFHDDGLLAGVATAEDDGDLDTRIVDQISELHTYPSITKDASRTDIHYGYTDQ